MSIKKFNTQIIQGTRREIIDDFKNRNIVELPNATIEKQLSQWKDGEIQLVFYMNPTEPTTESVMSLSLTSELIWIKRDN